MFAPVGTSQAQDAKARMQGSRYRIQEQHAPTTTTTTTIDQIRTAQHNASIPTSIQSITIQPLAQKLHLYSDNLNCVVVASGGIIMHTICLMNANELKSGLPCTSSYTVLVK